MQEALKGSVEDKMADIRDAINRQNDLHLTQEASENSAVADSESASDHPAQDTDNTDFPTIKTKTNGIKTAVVSQKMNANKSSLWPTSLPQEVLANIETKPVKFSKAARDSKTEIPQGACAKAYDSALKQVEIKAFRDR